MRLLEELTSLPAASHKYLLSQFLSAFYFTWPIFILFMSSHFRIESAGVYLSANAVTQMIAEIPTGYIADRIGQAKSVLIGSVISSLAFLLLLSGHSLILPLVSGVMVGIGSAFISGAADALVYRNVTHKEYEHTMHHQVTAFQSGLILSSLAGGFMYKISSAVPFVAQSLVIFLAALPLLALKDVYESNEEQPSLKDAGKALKMILTTKATLIFLAGYAILELLEVLFINILLESRMIELHIPPSSRGLLIGIVKLSIILALQLFILSHIRTVGRKLALVLTMAIVVFPLMGFGSNGWLFTVLYFFFNFVTVLSDSFMFPMKQKLVSNRFRATELSLYSMVNKATFATAALFTGIYLNKHTTVAIFYVLTLVFAFIGAPLLIWSYKHYKRQLAEDMTYANN